MMVLASIWPTTVEGWCGLISLILGLVGTIAALIPFIIKCVKQAAKLIKEKNWKKIMEIADAAMKAAEESGKSGAEKKEIVIEAVKAACKEAEIEIDESLLKQLADYIDQCINWHNDMSKKEEIK